MPKYKPFPDVVCQRIRNLIAKQGEIEHERKRMFEARDEAKGQLTRLTDGEKGKRQKLEADVGRAVIEIELLAKSEKWCKSELSKTVHQADEPGLFDDAEVTLPDFSSDRDDPEGDEGGEEDEAEPAAKSETRTVGRPDRPRPAPAAAPEAPEPAAAPLDLKFPGRFCIVKVTPAGPLKDVGLVGVVPCGDRERLDAWIAGQIGTERFTLSTDGIVTSNDKRLLHVTRHGDLEVLPADESQTPAKASGRKGKKPAAKAGKKAVRS